MAEEIKMKDFDPVSIEIMRLDKVPGVDLCLMSAEGPVLCRERNIRFTRRNLSSLPESNVEFLYFKSDDKDCYCKYIEDNFDRLVEDARVPPGILNKKRRLPGEEFENIKKHVEWGVEIAGKECKVKAPFQLNVQFIDNKSKISGLGPRGAHSG